MARNRSVATRIDVRTINELKKLFPNESSSGILRILAEERIAIQRNTKSLYDAREVLAGRKSNRNLL